MMKVIFWKTSSECSSVWKSRIKISEPRHDKTNKVTVRPAKTQISLGIRPVWSESSLCAQWVAMDPRFLHADSEDGDQTGRMPRLIWVFAEHTVTLLVLSCRGSFSLFYRLGQSVMEQSKGLVDTVACDFSLHTFQYFLPQNVIIKLTLTGVHFVKI